MNKEPTCVRRRDLALLALGGAHLLFVANGIFGVVGYGGSLGPAMGLYGNLSGAEMGYTFFAPEVPFEVAPQVRLLDAEGRELPALSPPTREETLRERGFALYFTQQEASRLAAAAFAADALGRVPETQAAVVTFRMHRLPTMAEYRRGTRPVDLVVYEGEFARR